MSHEARGEPARVLFLNPGAEIGGAERSLLELIRGLPRDRFLPYLLIPREGPLGERARTAGAVVEVNSWPRLLLRLGRERTLMNRLLVPLAPFLLLPVLVRIVRFARRSRIDILHANGTKSHLSSVAGTLAGLPVVWHVRDVIQPGPLRGMLRWLGRAAADRIVCNSRASAHSISPEGPGGKVQIVYNGLDPEEFFPQPVDTALRESLGLGAGAFVIGTVGALSPLKGHLFLIRALPGILEQAPEARLLIVGEEMYDTFGHEGYGRVLEQETKRLGVDGKVVFTGRREDVPALYGAMDVVVLASIRPESFGRVLVEAMASGRPVVSTDLGGPREIITSPGMGRLVPPGDSGALASAILDLWRDPDERSRMALAGRTRACEEFTLENHVAAICRVYDSLMSPGDPGRRRGAPGTRPASSGS